MIRYAKSKGRVNNNGFTTQAKAKRVYVNVPYFCEKQTSSDDIPTNESIFNNWWAGIIIENGQSWIEDISIANTLLTDMSIIQVIPSITLPIEVTMWGTVVADWVVRVYIENQTWNTLIIPSITIKTKKL